MKKEQGIIKQAVKLSRILDFEARWRGKPRDVNVQTMAEHGATTKAPVVSHRDRGIQAAPVTKRDHGTRTTKRIREQLRSLRTIVLRQDSSTARPSSTELAASQLVSIITQNHIDDYHQVRSAKYHDNDQEVPYFVFVLVLFH